MKSALIVLTAIVGLAVCDFSRAQSNSGADFLVGDWAIADSAGALSCVFPSGHGNQIEFEFARSGGRALLYEAPDLFTAVGGLAVHEDGDVLNLTAQTRSGETKNYLRIKRTTPDSAEIMPASSDRPATELRRCATGSPKIADSLNKDSVLSLTPPYSGGQGFPQLLTGETSAEVCDGKAKPSYQRDWAQFELIGPSNLWVMLRPGDFSTVVSAREVTAGTIDLSILNWESGKSMDLTIRIGTDQIDIPELHAAFARCRPDQPASLGMHRF